MKLANANKIRAKVLEAIMAYFVEADEDCGQIASNSFNFPIVEDGEEGWVEIVVKIPKEDEGYEKREEFQMKMKKKKKRKSHKQKPKPKD